MKTSSKKLAGLSDRQRQLIQNVGETGGNLSEAGRRCNPPYKCRQSAWQAWDRIQTRHPEIREQIEEHSRLKLAQLLDSLADLCKATKPIGHLQQYLSGEDGKIHRVGPGKATGKGLLEWPDWAARASGLNLAFKLRRELTDRGQIEKKMTEEDASIKVAAILKGRGKTWAVVRKHLITIGVEIPAGTPPWWTDL